MQVSAKISKIWWIDTRGNIRSTGKKAALVVLAKRIQDTVDRKYHCLLKDQTHLYEMLVALKRRLSPTERVGKRIFCQHAA